MIRSHVHLSGGLLARPLAGVPLVAIDLETTGLDVLRDRVIEIGLARWDPPRAGQHGRLSLYSHRVDPGRSVPRRAAEITGISSESLVGAPSFRDVLPTLRRFCDGAVAVLHNADADLGYLSGELGRANTTLELDGVLDTLAIARFVYRLPRANLDALAARLGFPHDRPHRALPDALATLRAARAFLAAWTGEPTAEALARAVVDHGPNGPGRARIVEQLRHAAHLHAEVLLDYASVWGPGSLAVRRRITVRRVIGRRVEAFCHLREAERVFHLDRIVRLVED